MESNKKIIDERHERQSMKNSSIVCTVMIGMLCVFHVIQTLFLQRNFSYFGPEFITLMTGCVLRIALDIRQGNVYTEMNAKTKLTAVLYVSAALVFSIVVGVRNYMVFGFEPWKIIFVILPLFLVTLVLMAGAHYAFLKASKKKLKKLEHEMEKDDD